jgi:hypothetical protein
VAARQVHAFCFPARELSWKVIWELSCNWMDSIDLFRDTNIEWRNWIKLARPEASCPYNDNECFKILSDRTFYARINIF